MADTKTSPEKQAPSVIEAAMSRWAVSVNSDVRVVERRAPTDESVRLLREMESAARDEVAGGVRVDGTDLNCVIHVARDALSFDLKFRAILSVNGRRIVVDTAGPFDEPMAKHADRLIEAVSRKLAIELVGPGLREAVRPLFPTRKDGG